MGSKKEGSIRIDASSFHDLLQKLSASDDSREEFKRNPQKFLKLYNITAPPNSIPKQVTLPGKERLKRALAKIPREAKAEAITAFLFFFLFAGSTSKKK